MNLSGETWTKAGSAAITFGGVWERQPVMLETAKTYLHWLLTGRLGKRRGWRTVRQSRTSLAAMATLLEENNQTSFANLSPSMIQHWWKQRKRNEGNKAVIECAIRLCGCRGLPNLPENPIPTLLARDFVVSEKGQQTEPIDDALWADMMRRALDYENDAHRLAEWLPTMNWRTPWLKEKGIVGEKTLRRYIWEVRMAGIVLVLAFTGMRKSELCALRCGALECLQGGDPIWVIWGTVFKFYGEGERARWVCGQIGRRGYAMLSGLAEGDGNLFPKGMGINLSEKLAWWLEKQQFAVNPNVPQLHAHQFRRTLARQLIVEDDITLVAIKEQFKHRTTVMTDYYIGADGHLLAKCLAKEPLLAMSLSDLNKEAGTDE